MAGAWVSEEGRGHVVGEIGWVNGEVGLMGKEEGRRDGGRRAEFRISSDSLRKTLSSRKRHKVYCCYFVPASLNKPQALGQQGGRGSLVRSAVLGMV